MRLNLIFLFCAILIVRTTAEIKAKRRDFGETCDSTLKCNKSLWLSCLDGICSCAKPDEMIYDSEKGKCASKAGERCKFEIDETVSDSVFKLYEKADCVTNAQCGADGTCNCKPTFYEAFNGSCLAEGNFKQRCDSTDQCRDDKFLACINDVCDCNSTKSEFSTPMQHCVGLAGQSCLNSRCTMNAECNIRTSKCTCTLPNQYYEDLTGRCKPKQSYGNVCNFDYECTSENVFLTCQDGICGCDASKSYKMVNYIEKVKNNDYRGGGYSSECMRRSQDGAYYKMYCHEYKEITKARFECVGRANQLCNDNLNCIENSNCSGQKCKCNADFTATSKGICGYGYNQKCDNNERECSDEFICSQGKCACKHPRHQLHTSAVDRCLSIVSGPCSSDSECISHTKCQINSNTKTGLCKCLDGYIENAEGKCDLAHGSQCQYNQGTSCDKLAALECRDGICSCPDQSLTYVAELGQCVGLVGSRCFVSESRFSKACVDSASCATSRQLTSGTCQCDEGFTESTNRLCTSILPDETTTFSTTTTMATPSTVSAEPRKLDILDESVPLEFFPDTTTVPSSPLVQSTSDEEVKNLIQSYEDENPELGLGLDGN